MLTICAGSWVEFRYGGNAAVVRVPVPAFALTLFRMAEGVDVSSICLLVLCGPIDGFRCDWPAGDSVLRNQPPKSFTAVLLQAIPHYPHVPHHPPMSCYHHFVSGNSGKYQSNLPPPKPLVSCHRGNSGKVGIPKCYIRFFRLLAELCICFCHEIWFFWLRRSATPVLSLPLVPSHFLLIPEVLPTFHGFSVKESNRQV